MDVHGRRPSLAEAEGGHPRLPPLWLLSSIVDIHSFYLRNLVTTVLTATTTAATTTISPPRRMPRTRLRGVGGGHKRSKIVLRYPSRRRGEREGVCGVGEGGGGGASNPPAATHWRRLIRPLSFQWEKRAWQLQMMRWGFSWGGDVGLLAANESTLALMLDAVPWSGLQEGRGGGSGVIHTAGGWCCGT